MRRSCVFVFFLVSNFNPRTHRGVRPGSQERFENELQFQSTHPSWGATVEVIQDTLFHQISIHAPIVGCDNVVREGRITEVNFNPRTHRGVRRS